MTAFFAEKLKVLVPIDDRGEDWLCELMGAARERALFDLVDALENNGAIRDFLGALCTLSPYLRETLITQPHFLEPLRHFDLTSQLEILIGQIAVLDKAEDLSERQLMRRLRQYKKHAALMIALGELAQLFDLHTTMRFLSRLAEATLGCVLRFLLRAFHMDGQILLPNSQNPESGCGLVLLGLGKLGSYELNYSSDIDLIAFIDETAPSVRDIAVSVDVFSKLMRRLVRILQERTEDGYVFRVDLRLRPDPASTPLALPFEAALHYYESRGQNWERAAFIKARVVAGDRPAGEKLLKELEPYVWRKYLDYAAIADIVAIKHQIHHARGLQDLTLPGANIKLGRGGIREIEFFVQIQQLITGGRVPKLRGRATLAMLDVLSDLGWITPLSRDELRKNYIFLRRVEHCIQMVADEQSHILPEDPEGFLTIAYLMGYMQAKSFSSDLIRIMRQVEEHYSSLFADEQDDKALDFTAPQANSRVVDALGALGFARPQDMYHIVHSWHGGHYRATHSSQARARLRQLTPHLLQVIVATKRADETLLQFDDFLRNLPAGVQLFSLLQSNKELLDMLILVLGSAPRLANIITAKPHVFDGMLEPALLQELPQTTQLEQRLALFLDQADNYEDKLDRLRIFSAEQHFLIGLRLLGQSIDGGRAGRAFSDLADLMINQALKLIAQEFVAQHGVVEGGKIAILALGKLGSCELRAGSDVDLILLYEHDEAFEMSDGAKPLYISQYYARLTQRLIAALSAPTAEGVLYQVDMRLRPSGNKGPVAVPFHGFSRYQRADAWVWEHLALTRARPIAGDGDLCARISADIGAILTDLYPHDRLEQFPKSGNRFLDKNCDENKKLEQKADSIESHSALRQEIATMRQRIAVEKAPKNIWDIKHIPGGIIDIEFIAQYAVLTGYVVYQAGQTTGDILSHLPKNFLRRDEKQDIIRAFHLYTNLNQMISLCGEEGWDLEQAPASFLDKILQLTGEPNLARLTSLIKEHNAVVHALFARIFANASSPQR